MPVPMKEIAKKMGLTIITDTHLTKDLSVFGQICFADGEINTYNEEQSCYIKTSVKRGTIFIDPNTYFLRCLGCVNNTIAHEAFHWERHRVYATVKNILTKKHIVAQRCPIRDEKKEKKFLDDKQAKQLIEGLKNYRDIRIKTALMTLLFTGIRRGELSGLEWGDIDLEEQTISIRRSCCQVTGMGIVTGDTKTQSSRRTIAIP
jgi:hypothetical protein